MEERRIVVESGTAFRYCSEVSGLEDRRRATGVDDQIPEPVGIDLNIVKDAPLAAQVEEARPIFCLALFPFALLVSTNAAYGA
ncbi:MAG: hypothetical protein AAF591_21120 [Verrucomicrobiota bacterium]